MRDLVVLAYADEHRAAEVLATLRRLGAGVFADVQDAVYLVRRTDWTVRLGRERDLAETDDGCLRFWRRLISSLILAPGVAGLFSDGVKRSLERRFKRDLAAALPPGSSAVLLVVRPETTENVKSNLLGFSGLVLTSTLDGYPDQEVALKD
jgi:uncharacterized membrane protein